MVWNMIRAVVSALCFGTLPILGKLGLSLGMSPLQVVSYRFSFGAVLLFAWMALARPELLRATPGILAKAAVLGWGLYPLQSYLFVRALTTIPASTTSLIFYFYPVSVTLLAMAFLGLRPGRLQYLSLAVILLGCSLIFHDAFSRSLETGGLLCAVACTLVFSAYLNLVQVFTSKGESQRISAWVVLFVAVAFSVLSPPTSIVSQPAKGWLVAAALGLIPTVLAVTLLYRAVETLGSARVSILSTVEPAFTVLLAALLLGEHVGLIQVAGMLCIIVGIIIPNASLLRRRAAVVPKP